MSALKKLLYFSIIGIALYLIIFDLSPFFYFEDSPKTIFDFFGSSFVKAPPWTTGVAGLLAKLFRIIGVVAVFTAWDRPRPTVKVVVFIAAVIGPDIVLSIVRLSSPDQLTGGASNFLPVFLLVVAFACLGLALAMVILLLRGSSKETKPILLTQTIYLSMLVITGAMLIFDVEFETLKVLAEINTIIRMTISVLTIMLVVGKLKEINSARQSDE